MNFYDTSSLLVSDIDNIEIPFVISGVTIKELEDIKTANRKDEEVKCRARRVGRFLKENEDKYIVVIPKINAYNEKLSGMGLDGSNDNLILCSVIDYQEEYGVVDFYTEDILLRQIAKTYFGLNVKTVDTQENIYKGYKVIQGTTEQINDAMENIDLSDWNVNEYLIIKNLDDDSEKEMRFNGERFVALKLPPSKFIKAKNSLQRCALDILNNQDITVAAILGGYGSGKTHLSLQMALYHVQEKGKQSKILGVRSPQGDGLDVGYLPGSMDEKTNNFFLPLTQQLNGGEFELESLKSNGTLETNIPYYMKGTTYDNTIMVVDEAEDLDEKQIRLVGTRVGQNSRIYFAGDYKQSVLNSTSSNALVKMCNEFKGKSCFATIYLGEDVRSSTSKMFANLFQE